MARVYLRGFGGVRLSRRNDDFNTDSMSFLPSLEQIRYQLLKESDPVEYSKKLSIHREEKKLAARANRFLQRKALAQFSERQTQLLQRYPWGSLEQYHNKKVRRKQKVYLSTSEWYIFCQLIAKHKTATKRARKKLGRFNKRKTKTERRSTYETYINSNLWTDRKNRFYQNHPRRCAACDSYKFIHLHHMVYSAQGSEPDEHLVPLCRDHHNLYHEKNGTQTNMLQKTHAFIALIKNGANTNLSH